MPFIAKYHLAFLAQILVMGLCHCIMFLLILVLCHCWIFADSVVYDFIFHTGSCTLGRDVGFISTLWMYLALRAWCFMDIIVVAVSILTFPFSNHCSVSLLDISSFCLKNYPCMGFRYHPAFLYSIDFSFYTSGSSSSFIKPSFHVFLSRLSSLFYRYCPSSLLLMLTPSILTST